ncbi:cytochrome c oxidase subunit 4 isoform 1, mitochondrial-like [Lutra lutra]|uniref:cytochrome c oxidase subunit 4 isoform 1, mitochondrial-like n=1 Tax=Lutra lutra TaxID=9657 RepID=UPI001FD02CB8|nr:cytochrome c oxidase subunit 4 isoform 1, mitochondrial-like [Lutra lutra]
MLVTRFLGLTGKSAVSSSVCSMRARGNVKSGDYALPSCVDRLHYPLPDVTYVKIFSASRMALKEKEEDPWSSFSMAEDVELCLIKFSENFADRNRSTNKCKPAVGAAMFFWGAHSRSDLRKALCVRPVPTHL